MLQVRFHGVTQKSFEQFKTDLDRAVEASFAAALMTRKWSDGTLHTAAPTTSGVIRYDMRWAAFTPSFKSPGQASR